MADIMFHLVIYLFLWRILMELDTIKHSLKEKEE